MILIFKMGKDTVVATSSWTAIPHKTGIEIHTTFGMHLVPVTWVAFEAVLPKAHAGVVDLRPLQ